MSNPRLGLPQGEQVGWPAGRPAGRRAGMTKSYTYDQ